MINTQANNLVNQDTIISWLIKWKVEFNNFDLTSLCSWSKTWIIITDHNFFDNGNIDIWAYVFSLIDWWWIYQKKYTNKDIQIKLFIQWESYEDLISRIDELKKNTQWIEAELDILVNWEYRTYIATCNSITIPNLSASQDFVDELQMNFTITNWNWYKKQPEYTYFANQTWNLEWIINNLWTEKSFCKIIMLMKDNWNNISNIEIVNKKIWDITWYPVTITSWVTNSDVLIFDYNEKIVTLNDEEIVFYWPMTPLETWYNVININITWSCNYDAYILYNKVYL